VQCTFNACPIIIRELAYALYYVGYIVQNNLCFAKRQFPVRETGFGFAPQVKYDLEEIVSLVSLLQCISKMDRQHTEQCRQIISYFKFHRY
jgi:hypothetical protein